MKIILASSNLSKLRELNGMLVNQNIELIPQDQFKIADAAETGQTFVENALLKARHATRIGKLPALADDSGLCVPSLNNAPGIFSARYAGKGADSEKNIQKLLADLKNYSEEQRKAYFYCVMVLLKHAEDPTPIICEGKWSGFIADKAYGKNGFGYDPIFFIPSEQKTAAEVSAEQKNKLSHRFKAMQQLIQKLSEKI